MLVPSRIVSAIRGAFVADAASMGTHWIYDPKEMKTTVSSVETPEFKDPPAPRFYSADEFPGHYNAAGMLSPYGEQLLFATEHVAFDNPTVDGKMMSEKMLEWAETFGGRPDSALKTFVENMKQEDKMWPNCGADDTQAHIYMKIVPVTCLYAGKSELVQKVTDAIRVHQNNNMAVSFGVASARILEGILLGGTLDQVLDTVQENLAQDNLPEHEAVLTAMKRSKSLLLEEGAEDLDEALLTLSHELMKDKSDSPFYDLAARSCGLPGSFIGPLYLFQKACHNKLGGESEWFEKALRENILASGDTCSRSVFVGAVLAAASDSVPQSWISKTDPGTYAKVDAAAQAIAKTSEATVE